MTFSFEVNARSLTPRDVARSFIPPEPHFGRLLTRSHSLLLGPRGSGKTTLLKMMTVSALRSWSHPDAHRYAPEIKFNGVFIPADVSWGKQVEALTQLEFNPMRKEAAFVLHTLRSLVASMREAAADIEGPGRANIPQLLVPLSVAIEEKIVQLVKNELGLNPELNSLLGLELALEARLNRIQEGLSDSTFSIDSLPSKLSLLAGAFNGITGEPDRQWALLFDEIEIAPPSVRAFLLAAARSLDQRFIIKLAMAPYMEGLDFIRSADSPHPLHDYVPISLAYANKSEAREFTEDLLGNLFNSVGIDRAGMRRLLRTARSPISPLRFTRSKSKGIPIEFISLAEKDESFAEYAHVRGIFNPDYELKESNLARDIRKVAPIVRARDFYLRKFESGGRVIADRSRKTVSLFTSYPALLEATEGNPRAILTLSGPLLEYIRGEGEMRGDALSIPDWVREDGLRRMELLLTTLLQVIPLDLSGYRSGRGLLGFVDQIGRSLSDRLLRRPFSADYVATFTLDAGVSAVAIAAVGRALNAGALVHVPSEDSFPDMLLRSPVGQKFRVSYTLSARYRLLLTLGGSIALSRLLAEGRELAVGGQPDLLEGASHDPQ